MLCVTLEFAGESAIKKASSVIKKEIRTNNELLPRAKIVLNQFLDTLIDFIPFIQAVHRGLFYFYGNKYQLSKRMTGINYVLVRYWLKQDHSVFGYKILGAITLLQAFISITIYLRQKFTKVKTKQKVYEKLGPGIKSKSGKICVLCMDVRSDASVIRCGHVFCYDCILNWLKTKNECPVCRDPAKPSNVVFLRNYQGV